MKVKQLKAYERNPRRISEVQQRILAKGLAEFGDLSGVVFNVRNKRLVGGHQRSGAFEPGDEVSYVERISPPDAQGTVALGFIVSKGNRYAYREVDWDERRHMAACLVANRGGGEWDYDALRDIAAELREDKTFDAELTGFTEQKLDDLVGQSDAIVAETELGFLRKREIANQVSELADIELLKPHPDNYREHPEDQLVQLQASVEQLDAYRPVVVASDYTILAGHALWEVFKRQGLKRVPVKRKDFGPQDSRALKILTNDNEMGRFAVVDDRKLTEVLKRIKDTDPQGLMGTGYDDKQLAALVLTTRHQDEVADIDEATEWVGMPKFENGEVPYKLVISFDDEGGRNELLKRLKVKGFSKAHGKTLSMWWPPRERQDMKSVAFQADGKVKRA